MKSTFRSFLGIVKVTALPVFLLALIAASGCDNPTFHNRPSNESCMKVLVGQKLVLEKGLLIDHTWTIEAGEFTQFSIERIVKNSDGTSTADVKFELQGGEKVLRVEGAFVYRFHRDDGYIEFKSFRPTRLLKLGVWR